MYHINCGVPYNDPLRSYVRNAEYTEKYSCRLSMLAQDQYSSNILFPKTIVLWQRVCSSLSSLFFFANSKILFHISCGHSNGRLRCNRMSYFLTCFSFPSLCIPLTWINLQRWLARVEQKGFSCLEENVLRTVTIEMIGKFLPSLIHPFLSSILSFCFRYSSRIAPPRYCAHKRITTYTS